jgi:hypothetical protein
VFVRWKLRRQSRFLGRYRGNRSELGEWIASAVLVESARVGGKPRQRFVRHLGTIHEADVTVPSPMQLDRFWSQVDAVLDDLDVHGAARLEIENTISVRRRDAPGLHSARSAGTHQEETAPVPVRCSRRVEAPWLLGLLAIGAVVALLAGLW